METLFRVGDQVRVVNYGHLVTGWKDGESYCFDTSPEKIGITGIVVEAHQTQGIDSYALHGPNVRAWYDNGQLELIYRPDYRLGC